MAASHGGAVRSSVRLKPPAVARLMPFNHLKAGQEAGSAPPAMTTATAAEGTCVGWRCVVKEMIAAPSFSTLRKEVDRFLDRVREGDALEFLSSTDWLPNVDFSEMADAYNVKVEIPGIDPKDIEVVFQNGMLTIRGQKVKSETEDKGARFYRTERSFGAFARNLRIPTAVDEKLISANFKHGLLTVMLPKTAETRGQSIPIKIS